MGLDFEGSPPRNILSIIRMKWLVFLTVSLTIFIGLAVVVLKMTPRYTAEATLILPSVPATDLAEKTSQSFIPPTDPYIIHSYADVLKDPAICRIVVERLHLANNKEFEARKSVIADWIDKAKDYLRFDVARRGPWSERDAAEDQTLAKYRKSLNVFNDGRSLTVELSFQAADPILAAQIVDAHVAAFISNQIAYRSQVAGQKTAWLKRQLDVAASELRTAQVALQTHLVPAAPQAMVAADQTAELKSRLSIVTARQNVYEALLSRYAIMTAEEKYVGSDTRVVSQSAVPTVPTFPNKPIFLAIAAVISIIAGGLAALVMSAMQKQPIREEDIVHRLGLPLLGVVQLPTRMLIIGRSSRKLRLAYFWEQIRSIRCFVRLGEESGRVTAITSYLPDEGKSLVAASLARAISSAGTKTLLIDLDMRRPNAHTLLSVSQNETCGLGEALQRKVKTSAATICVDPSGSLYLLSGATLGAKDIDALAGVRLKLLLSRLKREFKVIILDTPPIGVVSDAIYASILADETIIVAQSGPQFSSNLPGAVKILANCSINVQGVVITKRDRPEKSAYSYLQNYFYHDKLVELSPIPRRRLIAFRKLPRRLAAEGAPNGA